MYLSRIALNTQRKSTIIALSSPQNIHAAVESSFPPAPENTKRNLWRIDRLNNAVYLIVLSNRKPDFSHIVEQFGWPKAEQKWETKDYTSLLEKITQGQRWQFRLRANPVHSISQTCDIKNQGSAKRGKIYAHITVQQQEKWLLDRAAKYGFSLQEGSFCVTQRDIRKFQRNRKQVTLSIVTFEGVLEVEDVTLFQRALTNGIGRAKAYGCGLLTIKKVSS